MLNEAGACWDVTPDRILCAWLRFIGLAYFKLCWEKGFRLFESKRDIDQSLSMMFTVAAFPDHRSMGYQSACVFSSSSNALFQ